jgi:hypothetical protein
MSKISKSKSQPLSTLERARLKWADAIMPDWVERLAIECSRSSQNKVAAALDRSATMISQVLSRTYPGDMAAIEDRVRGVYMDQTVICPALGDLPTQVCQDWRDKARVFALGNPMRTRMYRACQGCPRNTPDAK